MKTQRKKSVKLVLLKDIHLRLTRFRNEAPGILGIPFEEILKKCGIPEEEYRACEQGRKKLRMNHLDSLFRECKLNSNWLLGGRRPMFLLKANFSPRFREFRETAPGILGIPFDEILKRCGIPEKEYRAYEQGLKQPRADHLFSLSKEFNLNINWFFGIEDAMFVTTNALYVDTSNEVSDRAARSILFKRVMENPDAEKFFLSLTEFLLSMSEDELKNLFQSWAGLYQNFNRISGKLSKIFGPQPVQTAVARKKTKLGVD